MIYSYVASLCRLLVDLTLHPESGRIYALPGDTGGYRSPGIYIFTCIDSMLIVLLFPQDAEARLYLIPIARYICGGPNEMANSLQPWNYVQLALLCVACCTSMYAAHGPVAKAVNHVWSSVDYVRGTQRALQSNKQAIMQSELQLLYSAVFDVKTLNSSASLLQTMPSSSGLIQTMRNVLRGRHIIFIGDSVTR